MGPRPPTPDPAPASSTPTGAARALRIAAVGDLHIHKTPRTPEDEPRPLLAEMARRADVLLLAGDLTGSGLPEEAARLAGEIAAANLRIPVLAVLGNHDVHAGHAEEVRAALRSAGVRFLDEESVEVRGDGGEEGERGVGFAGVKGFGGGFGDRMLAPFGEGAMKAFATAAVSEALALESALKSLSTPRRVVVLHYAPIPETVRGEPPEIYPFLGCSRLAEVIDRFAVAAVFHGHAHHGSPRGATPRGTPVYNVSIDLLRRVGPTPYVVVEVPLGSPDADPGGGSAETARP